MRTPRSIAAACAPISTDCRFETKLGQAPVGEIHLLRQEGQAPANPPAPELSFFATKFLRGLANNPPHPGASHRVASPRSFTTAAMPNYANLLAAGYRVCFFLNDVERDNVSVADSEGGTITIGALERKGQVEIRLDKLNSYLRDEVSASIEASLALRGMRCSYVDV